MFRRFFGRKDKSAADPQLAQANEKAKHARPAAFPAGVKCGRGCGETEGYRCEYEDSTGRRCGWWCADHTTFMYGRAWCERHAGSVKWLAARDGSLYEIGRMPAIDDRSPNLVAIIVEMLDAELSRYLRETFAMHPGAQVVTDAQVRPASIPTGAVEPDAIEPGAIEPDLVQEGRQVAWERGWRVYSEVGYLARVVLRVTATEPPVVHVFVSDTLVLSRIPDWIANRGRGADPHVGREDFRRAVVDAVVKNVVLEPG